MNKNGEEQQQPLKDDFGWETVGPGIFRIGVLTTTTTEDPEHLIAKKISLNGFYPNLENLYLKNVGAKRASTKNWEALMPKLETLDLLMNQNLDVQDLMKNFPRSIKNLSLTNNNVKFVDLTDIQNLNILKIDENNFTNFYITDNVTTCQSKNQLCIGWLMNLIELSATNCHIKQFNIEYFSFDPLPNLKILDLSENRLRTLSDFQTSTKSLPQLS